MSHIDFTIYEADYNPIPSHLDPNPLRDVFDQGNKHFEYTEPLTSKGQYKRVVHRSLDHLYYRDFLTNNKASFGSGHVNKQYRYLEDKAKVISIPQSKFGESILPGSVKVVVDYTVQHGLSILSNEFTLIDDSYGNLIVSGSMGLWSGLGIFTSNHQNPVLQNAATMSATLVGSWPFDDVYKWVDAGLFSYTSSFNRGLWSMETIYKSVSATNINQNNFLTPSQTTTPFASSDDLLGAVLHFTASENSSLEIKPKDVDEYRQKYNFENSDFIISCIIHPTELPTDPSGSIVYTKEGSHHDVRVDEKGIIHTSYAKSSWPYKLVVLPDGSLEFSVKARGQEAIKLTALGYVEINRTYHIVVIKMRTDNQIRMYVYSKGEGLANEFIYSTTDDPTLAITVPFSDGIDKLTKNDSNIFVGNNRQGNQGFCGYIDNFQLYKPKTPLTDTSNSVSYIEGYLDSSNDLQLLFNTSGVGNRIMGNVFYNHGMITLTAIPTRFMDIVSVECRGTHTIWENEVSCTVSPGEFGMSSNPTLEEYDGETDQYKYRSFVTGSDFKPYVTTIGLYDNLGRLLVVGKLSTPIQTLDNTDTTFIIRYDK
jgi:hypothetical protein